MNKAPEMPRLLRNLRPERFSHEKTPKKAGKAALEQDTGPSLSFVPEIFMRARCGWMLGAGGA